MSQGIRAIAATKRKNAGGSSVTSKRFLIENPRLALARKSYSRHALETINPRKNNAVASDRRVKCHVIFAKYYGLTKHISGKLPGKSAL